jgi:hypothetical protein
MARLARAIFVLGLRGRHGGFSAQDVAFAITRQATTAKFVLQLSYE